MDEKLRKFMFCIESILRSKTPLLNLSLLLDDMFPEKKYSKADFDLDDNFVNLIKISLKRMTKNIRHEFINMIDVYNFIFDSKKCPNIGFALTLRTLLSAFPHFAEGFISYCSKKKNSIYFLMILVETNFRDSVLDRIPEIIYVNEYDEYTIEILKGVYNNSSSKLVDKNDSNTINKSLSRDIIDLIKENERLQSLLDKGNIFQFDDRLKETHNIFNFKYINEEFPESDQELLKYLKERNSNLITSLKVVKAIQLSDSLGRQSDVENPKNDTSSDATSDMNEEAESKSISISIESKDLPNTMNGKFDDENNSNILEISNNNIIKTDSNSNVESRSVKKVNSNDMRETDDLTKNDTSVDRTGDHIAHTDAKEDRNPLDLIKDAFNNNVDNKNSKSNNSFSLDKLRQNNEDDSEHESEARTCRLRDNASKFLESLNSDKESNIIHINGSLETEEPTDDEINLSDDSVGALNTYNEPSSQ